MGRVRGLRELIGSTKGIHARRFGLALLLHAGTIGLHVRLACNSADESLGYLGDHWINNSNMHDDLQFKRPDLEHGNSVP